MKMTAMAGRRARVAGVRSAKETLGAIIPIILCARAEAAAMHPFGISLFGAIMPGAAGAAALAAGSALLGVEGIKYILCGAAFFALETLRRMDRIVSSFVMGAILALGGIMEMLWFEPSLLAAAAAVAEGVAGGILFYMFGALRTGGAVGQGVSRERVAARLLLLGACINGVSGVVIPPGIELNIFFGIISLMLICRSVSLCESVTAGMVLGLLCTMNGQAALNTAGMFALCALFASVLSDLGKWGVVLGFLCGSALCAICSSGMQSVAGGIFSLTAAVGVFLLIPDFAGDFLIRNIRALAYSETDTRGERERLAKKLKFVTKQHSDICSGLKRINAELEREEREECTDVIYSVSTAVAQRADGEGAVSGDSFLEFDSETGRHYVILCDGMGSGRRAYRESKMTAELLREFLRTGFLKDKAVSMLNSALAIKGDDESFSTVDLFEFDECSGDAEFLKIGSAQSFIRHREEVETLSSASLPVGIVEDVRTVTISRRLSAGDVVVMVSDGIGEAGYGVLKGEWIKRLIKSANGSMRALADEILAEAVRRSNLEMDDDMTVVAMRIERAKDAV